MASESDGSNSSPAQSEDDDDADFFTSKKEQRYIESEDEKEAAPIKVSKKQLRKITKDGPYQGKNKVFFDSQGKPISSLEYHLTNP